jgi:uncharacterized integral membrane protein
MESSRRHSEGPQQTSTAQTPPSTIDRKRMVALVVIAVAAIWLVAFILSNSEIVRVSFVFGDVSLSLIWVMIICAVLGAALAFAIPWCRRRR